MFTGPDTAARTGGRSLGAVARLAAGLLAVLFSARLFTNGLEWFGRRAGVAHAALGSVFAALGTALPEGSIAVLAALAPGRAGAGVGDAVSLGAVLGAPLLLSTLGFALLGLGVLRAGRGLAVPPRGWRGDLVFFLSLFGPAALLGVAGAPPAWRWPLGAALLLAYAVFVLRALAREGAAPPAVGEAQQPLLLQFRRRAGTPPAWPAIALQILLAMAVMFVGAELFVHTLTALSARLGLSGFVLAALIAPLATELPETANSLVWLAQGKDALAAGNVSGALVLQGAVIPALGMWFTPWAFGPAEGVAALVALLCALFVWLLARPGSRLPAWVLLLPGLAYLGFVAWVL